MHPFGEAHQHYHEMLTYAANNKKVYAISLTMPQYLEMLEAGCASLLASFSSRKKVILKL